MNSVVVDLNEGTIVIEISSTIVKIT